MTAIISDTSSPAQAANTACVMPNFSSRQAPVQTMAAKAKQTREKRARSSISSEHEGDDGKKTKGRPRVEKIDESAGDVCASPCVM